MKYKYLVCSAVCLSIVTSPLYLFASGLPQIADYIAAFGILLLAIKSSDSLLSGLTFRPFMLLVLLIFFVSLTWSIMYPNGPFLTFFLFYLFNYLFCATLMWLNTMMPNLGKYILQSTKAACALSFLGVVASYFFPIAFFEYGNYRVVGFFNNPNQLAYFSVCTISLITVLNGRQLNKDNLSLLCIGFAFVSILASTSLAGMLSLFPMILVMPLVLGINKNLFIKILPILVILPIVLVSINYFTGNQIFEATERRFSKGDQKYQNIQEERKYERIIDYPLYNFVGAAEGATERFDGGSEIHSTFGTLLFSYGFLGLYLFIWQIFRVAKGLPPYAILSILPPLLYGITHNGLRSTTFWLLLVALQISKPLSSRRVLSADPLSASPQISLSPPRPQ